MTHFKKANLRLSLSHFSLIDFFFSFSEKKKDRLNFERNVSSIVGSDRCDPKNFKGPQKTINSLIE